MISKSEREDRIARFENSARGLYGDQKFVGVLRGTGWGRAFGKFKSG